MDYTIRCSKCGKEYPIRDNGNDLPEPDEVISHWCKECEMETSHSYVLTRKFRAALRQKQKEEEQKQYIRNLCEGYGFTCRFLYQSVIITTPLSDWCFDYHESQITLWHESTIKVNFDTGDYAKAHCQFRKRKMTEAEVIKYISEHEKWVSKNRKPR